MNDELKGNGYLKPGEIGPLTTVLVTERAPHVSDIRNQE